MRTAKIGPDLSWLLSLLRFVLSLCEKSEAVPPGFFNFLVSVEELLSDNKWILAIANNYRDSEWFLAIANKF